MPDPLDEIQVAVDLLREDDLFPFLLTLQEPTWGLSGQGNWTIRYAPTPDAPRGVRAVVVHSRFRPGWFLIRYTRDHATWATLDPGPRGVYPSIEAARRAADARFQPRPTDPPRPTPPSPEPIPARRRRAAAGPASSGVALVRRIDLE